MTRITVLMPMHNNAATVHQTVASILAQTHSDFEFLIIDDASTDNSIDAVQSFNDPRIRLLRNESHLEITPTLNRGLDLARTEFIARIDADDVALPGRLARQLEYLDAHLDIAILGSFVQTFSGKGDGPVWKFPAEPTLAAAGLLFRCTLAHPAVMLRRPALEAKSLRYNLAFRRSQDYDLWLRCIQAGLRLGNVPDVFLRYRLHADQATQRDLSVSREAAATVREQVIRWLGIHPTAQDLALHESLSLDRLQGDEDFATRAINWLEKLADANAATRRFSPESFLKVLTGRYVAVRRTATGARQSEILEPFVY